MSKSVDCEEILKQTEKDAQQLETVGDCKKMVELHNKCCENIEKAEQSLNSYTYIVNKPEEFADVTDREISLEKMAESIGDMQKKMDSSKTTLDETIHLFLEIYSLIGAGKKYLEEQKLNITNV
jgi:hypothetical protein